MRLILVTLIALLCLAHSGSIVSAAIQGTNKQERIIASIYEGFLKGDLTPTAKNLAAKYTWGTQTAAEFHPIVGSFDNNAGAFVQAFPYNITSFVVESLTSNKNQVIALIRVKYVMPSTGKEDTTLIAEVWTFDSKSKITGYLEIRDTAALLDVLTSGQTQYSLTRFATEDIKKFNSRNAELAYSDYHPNAKISINNGDIVSVAEAKKGFAEAVASFPDMHYEILSITAGGDRVVIQLKNTGTFTGKPYMGIPPNGKSFTLYSTIIETVLDGKIVEEHEDYDTAAIASVFG